MKLYSRFNYLITELSMNLKSKLVPLKFLILLTMASRVYSLDSSFKHTLSQAILLGGSYYFQYDHIPDNTVHYLGEFPTQRFDEKIRNTLHGKEVYQSWTKKESNHSLMSDIGLLGLAVPFGINLSTISNDSWVKLMHSFSLNLFLTNI